MIVLADWTAPAAAISGMVAAIVALVTIFYAKRSADAGRVAAEAGRDAAQASRDAVELEQAMRIEEDFRRFGDALISLWQYAGDAQKNPGSPEGIASVRHAQIRLVARLNPRVRIDLPDEAVEMLDKALTRDTPPDQIYSAASAVLGHLENSWDSWLVRQVEGDLDPKGPPLTIRKRGYETPHQRGNSAPG